MTDEHARATIGLTGLATMGRNLARNIARNGHTIAVHNRTTARTALLDEYGGEGDFVGAGTLEELVASIVRPRAVVIMVKAGEATDAVIDELVPLLDEDDIVVDAGNAHFADTVRRQEALAAHGLHFVGMGVSGGEGALNGPSIMVGGSEHAYERLRPVVESIAAVVDGTPCCAHVGPDGAGHFVKMVHNGIEYADMQLIAESYDLLRSVLGLEPAQVADIFEEWNGGDLESFLIEMTADVLRHTDAATGQAFVDVVRDAAEQKGTGRWTVQNALELGVPVTGIAEATFARSLSGHTEQLAAARAVFTTDPETQRVEVDDVFVDQVRAALYASKVVAYAQGSTRSRPAPRRTAGTSTSARSPPSGGAAASSSRAVPRPDQGGVRRRAGPHHCSPAYFADAVKDGVDAWREVVATAARGGVPTRRSPRRWPTSTGCAATGCRRRSSRRCGTTRGAYVRARGPRGHVPHPVGRDRACRGPGRLTSRRPVSRR